MNVDSSMCVSSYPTTSAQKHFKARVPNCFRQWKARKRASE
jgi:hypothetical protein